MVDRSKSMKEVTNWFTKLNNKIMETFYKPCAEGFDPNENYRKPFRKHMDFYDLNSDEYLLSELVFKELYNLRETIA